MRKAYPEDRFPAPTVVADRKSDLPKRAQRPPASRKTRGNRELRSSGWGIHQQDEQS